MQKSSLRDKINTKLNVLIVPIVLSGLIFLLFSIVSIISSRPFIFLEIITQNNYGGIFLFLIIYYYVLFLGIFLPIAIYNKNIISKCKSKDRIYRLYYELLVVFIFAEIIMTLFFILHFLPFFYPSFDYLNFIEPASNFMMWASLVQGIIICAIFPIFYYRKRKLMQDFNNQ